ncbi:Hypothetical predicted protein [Mytilus galloprovincialis]|uniref:Tesmin/TSO1-like CXC domain-containing protein n=1 Tax=Mytilus galloprovincialis TaxID=29158 RepID=A0A8B6FPD0_MYTGA|nr:Hypothetical predicted protein [Mytilus galloprovincialis]
MPACADYNSAMQDTTGVGYCTCDQHKEATRARKERDRVDTIAILEYLTERNPFANDVSLRNIETGVEAELMLTLIKLKSNQSITLAAKPKSKSDSDFLNTDIDPQLMFQRITTAANGLFENTSEVFQYELSSVPSSLFDCNRLPREACKSNLADAIWACGSDCIHEIDGEGFQYVLDGGSLLQRLPTDYGWKIKRGKLCPILMDLPPAPDKLLNIIRCNCKQNCDTKRCVCRKNGLRCSVGCGECRGLNCSNSVPIVESDFTESRYLLYTKNY